MLMFILRQNGRNWLVTLLKRQFPDLLVYQDELPRRSRLGFDQLYGDKDQAGDEQDDQQRYEDSLPVPGFGWKRYEFLEQYVYVYMYIR